MTPEPDLSTPPPATPRSAAPPIHLRHIVVPVDFSAHTAKAVHYAESLARTFGARITLLHVFQMPYITYDPVVSEVAVAHCDEIRRQARKRLDELCQTIAQETGLPVSARLLEGSIHREIADAVRQLGADLIVLPTQGHTGLQHALHLGSTAERVVRYAPCPVLVVRDHEHDFIG